MPRLRTPLAILRTELELALAEGRTPEELRAALASAAEETDRLNQLSEDLLTIAQTERGELPLDARENVNRHEAARLELQRHGDEELILVPGPVLERDAHLGIEEERDVSREVDLAREARRERG